MFWASMSDYYYIRRYNKKSPIMYVYAQLLLVNLLLHFIIRFLYLISLLIFVGASVGCAVVRNIWLLVVFRCIQSVGTSGNQNGNIVPLLRLIFLL